MKAMRRHRNQRGDATLEAVLAVPVLLLLIFMVLQFGLYYHAAHSAEAAAQEGARAARLDGGTAADGRARAEVAPLLLTIPDAARVLAIGRTTLYELIDTRALEVVRIGRAIRVPVSALESFVERARAAGDVPSSTTRGPDRVAARSGPEPTT